MAEKGAEGKLTSSVSAPTPASRNAPPDAHGISINLPPDAADERPPPIRHVSNPAYKSPIRHHQRTPSRSKGVKETLNARSSYGSGDDGDGPSVHRINQYIIKQEIGRGSFGSVHLAEDQYGKEFAVKEFSKSRLRKRAQSNLLRKPNQGRKAGQIAAGLGFNSPMHRLSSSDLPSKASANDDNNSLSLIKEEIAIMKKLDHNNLVSLVEVLDDPQEDSLYMVLEMCKKGVAMKVGLEERAEPYDDETCRCWFRDMILGIEYLHAQGIIHRDIKPDNCLITDDDVLKIVDFGVSEMFEKASDMATAKSAGSPAFMPPELCVARHGQVSGRAADIWSMGVTLYCLRYGHIPFEKESMLELYESIRSDDIPLQEERDPHFADLMRRLLEKDPEKRITMDELRDHPWVTKNDTDPLLSAEDNCADLVDPPTEAEKDQAITGNMAHLLAVMGAVKRFKNLLHNKRGRFRDGMSILGANTRMVQPPQPMQRTRTRSEETDERKPMDQILATEGVHRSIDVADDSPETLPRDLNKKAVQQDDEPLLDRADTQKEPGETQGRYKQRMEALRHHPSISQDPAEHRYNNLQRASTFPLAEHAHAHARGQAHDPLEDRFYLYIGPNAATNAEHDALDPDHADDPAGDETPIVSESPPAVEMNIYELAYRDEMERIMARRGPQAPSMYMTRRVEHRDDIRSLSSIKDAGRNVGRAAALLYERGHAGAMPYAEAGRNAARAAAGKMSDKIWPPDQAGTTTTTTTAAAAAADAEGGGGGGGGGGSVESVRSFAKSAASEGVDASRSAAKNAGDVLGGLYNAYSAADSKRSGLANLVAQARAQARGDASDAVVAGEGSGVPPLSSGQGGRGAQQQQEEEEENGEEGKGAPLLHSLTFPFARQG